MNTTLDMDTTTTFTPFYQEKGYISSVISVACWNCNDPDH